MTPRPAGCLSRLNGLFAAGPPPPAAPRGRTRSGSAIRLAIRSNIAVFTSRRIRDAISSSVENAGSSNDALTSISSATLIRSGGLFLTSAADRIASAATARARSGSCTTPSALAHQTRAATRPSRSGAVGRSSGSLKQSRRTCSTTAYGDLHRPREVPQALKAPQRQHQRQQVLIRASARPGPRDLVLCRAQRGQLPGGHQPPKPRVRRPLDRRHRTTSRTRPASLPQPDDLTSRLLPVSGVSWLYPKRTLTLAGEQRALVMDVLVLINTLDDLVHNAKPIPLTDQVRMDKEGIYDILDQIRATIPDEIKQARWIVKERQEMQAEATREAERIVKDAREREERLISDDEVTKQAERAAADIIEDARGREREILLGAEDYADEILNTLEVNLSRFNAAVQRGRDRLERKDASAEIG